MTPQEVMVPMRDGVRLQSFVHLPGGPDDLPRLEATSTPGSAGRGSAQKRGNHQGTKTRRDTKRGEVT